MYVDLDLIYALIKEGDRHQETAKKILGQTKGTYTSVVTLLELEIVVKREMNDFLSTHVGELFQKHAPTMKIVPLTEVIFKKSLALREKYGLGIFDSIHAATALTHDKKIASTDKAFERVTELKRADL